MKIAKQICNQVLPKPEINLTQMKELFDVMINASAANDENKRKLRISKILYSEEEEIFKASTAKDSPSLFEQICRKRLSTKFHSNFNLYLTIIDLIAPVNLNIARLRLFMVAVSSWLYRYDARTTVAIVIGQMNSFAKKKNGKTSIDRSKLAEAIFNDFDKLEHIYQDVVLEASNINSLPKDLVEASLTEFLATRDKGYIRLQQVCLALFPKNRVVLTALFNQDTIANDYVGWKRCFETLATNAGHTIDPSVHKIFQNELDALVHLFLKIILPVCSLSHWAGAVALSMALINVKAKVSTQQVPRSCSKVLELLGKHRILMFEDEDVPALAREISIIMSETHGTAVVLPEITAESNSAEIV